MTAGDIVLGVVIGAQGLRGEVKVKTFTETPGHLSVYGPLRTEGGRTLEIASVRAVKAGSAIVQFKGIDDRSTAESLANVKLLVERAALPATAKDEFYHADLVGLRALDAEGRTIGAVIAIHNFGAGDVIELSRTEGGTLLLPFTRETVPTIDLAEKFVVVAEPKDVEAEAERGVE